MEVQPQMICPHCNQQATLHVKETRLRDGDVVRRRECAECGNHFGTRERYDPDLKMARSERKKPVRKAPAPVERIDLLKVWK
jgi:transcriptional regulator NrdR family protein